MPWGLNANEKQVNPKEKMYPAKDANGWINSTNKNNGGVLANAYNRGKTSQRLEESYT